MHVWGVQVPAAATWRRGCQAGSTCWDRSARQQEWHTPQQVGDWLLLPLCNYKAVLITGFFP